jgi:Domain of unknown function (DUF4351)
MKESVIYQNWYAQRFKEGSQRDFAIAVVGRLKRLIGNIESEDEIRISALSVEQLKALGEALLDFSSRDDLLAWLANA